MAWFKIDDKLITSQKVLRIPRSMRPTAIGVWTLCGTWSAHAMSDGFVPDHVLEEYGCTDEVRHELVCGGLWDEAEGGILFHDWCDYQPTREELEAKREAVSASRAKAGKVGGQRSGENRSKREANVKQNEANAKQNEAPNPNPNPNQTTANAVVVAHPSLESSFNLFWNEWPRAEGKKSALTAWAKAVKKTQPEVIISAAKAFSASPYRPEKQFIPYAATWLNGERWTDPLPDAPEAEKPKGAPTPYVPTLDEFKSMLCLHGRPSNACERCDEESAHG